MAVSDRLKNVRESLDKSQKEMAEFLGVNYRTYQNYENALSAPNWDTMDALIAFGIDANWLFTGSGNMWRAGFGPELDRMVAAAERIDAIHEMIHGKKPEDTGPVLDLELMEEIIVRTIKAQRSTGVDHEDMVANGLAIMTATSIVNQYRSEKGLPSPSSNEILNNYNKMFAALNDQLTTIADKRDKEREG